MGRKCMKILLMIFKHTQKDIKIEISECPKISLFQRIKCKNVEDRRRNPKRELLLKLYRYMTDNYSAISCKIWLKIPLWMLFLDRYYSIKVANWSQGVLTTLLVFFSWSFRLRLVFSFTFFFTAFYNRALCCSRRRQCGHADDHGASTPGSNRHPDIAGKRGGVGEVFGN